MPFSSRTKALLLSGLVAIVLTTFAWLVPHLPFRQGILAAGITIAACFLLIYLSFEALIFQEINSIYAGLENVKRKEFRRLSNKFLFRPEPLKRIRNEIFRLAEHKQREIDELRRLQVLRREFLADVSHELKTPIFAAQGFLHTVLDGDMDDDFLRNKFLRKAATSLDTLDTLVQELVTISQLEKGVVRLHKQDFDLTTLVEEIFEQLEAKAAQRSVTLQLAWLGAPVAHVLADRNRIRQVIVNLVDNAIKYGRPAGIVTVLLTENKKSVQVSVQDDGEGIAREHHHRIFERFYRIDKSRSRDSGGSGLGLAISKHIVEAHKSVIQVESEVGAGTRLTFKLPRAKSTLGTPGAAAPAA